MQVLNSAQGREEESPSRKMTWRKVLSDGVCVKFEKKTFSGGGGGGGGGDETDVEDIEQ